MLRCEVNKISFKVNPQLSCSFPYEYRIVKKVAIASSKFLCRRRHTGVVVALEAKTCIVAQPQVENQLQAPSPIISFEFQPFFVSLIHRLVMFYRQVSEEWMKRVSRCKQTDQTTVIFEGGRDGRLDSISHSSSQSF